MSFLTLPARRSLTRAVKQQAERLGFGLAGATTPDPPLHLDVYERWVDAGRHGGMSYLAEPRARQRRANPRLILPECRSILVLGIHHATLPALSQPSAGSRLGQIAAYAWGADYHDVLPGRLQALVTWLEAETGHPVLQRSYTDTGPLMERALAQRAGLGWIGKNTCLIHPRQGSFLLLAEILLDLELEPDAPFDEDRCGSCRRCKQACPTQCILPDRTLDAQRCISYLTIENKGAIPLDLRPLIGNRVFGCDVCQQVCPWNQRFAAAAHDPALAARPGQVEPDLLALVELTPQEFNRRFKGSPVQRARRRGLLRNAVVALGNCARGTADPEAAKALARALEDAEALVRQHAAWALGQVGGRLARQALESATVHEPEAIVRAEILAALQ